VSDRLAPVRIRSRALRQPSCLLVFVWLIDHVSRPPENPRTLWSNFRRRNGAQPVHSDSPGIERGEAYGQATSRLSEYWKWFLSWLFNIGKDPESAEGYSPYTVYGTNYWTARFDRWVWNRHDGYHIPPSYEDAKAYLQELAYSDKSQTVKRKAQEGLRRYSRWLSHEHGHDKWEFEYSFDGSGNQPRNYLTRDERRQIRRAALEEGSIPSYESLTVAEREQWGDYIA